jgi:hypothetical protein
VLAVAPVVVVELEVGLALLVVLGGAVVVVVEEGVGA